MADNCSKYLEVYFAAAKIGMSVTPLNVRLGDDEIVFIVNDSEATIFVVGDAYEESINKLKGSFTNIKTWITLDNPVAGFPGLRGSCWRNRPLRNPILINMMSRKTTWPFSCTRAEPRGFPRA